MTDSGKPISETISKAYGKIASEANARAVLSSQEAGALWGYTVADMALVPEGANLGLGCGNPLALDSMQAGETVLDLGSGAGFDSFLAASRVGPTGFVIGVDITPEMLARAVANAEAGGYTNVEFRHGDLQDLPVDDESVDVVISNCVISLVRDRAKVYRETFRVLKPGGRLTISDTFVTREIDGLDVDPQIAEVAHLGTADTADEYVAMVASAGFVDVELAEVTPLPPELAFDPSVEVTLRQQLGVPDEVIETAKNSMVSISLTGRKP